MSLSKLYCIIDRSGSMAEYGKPMLMVNLLRYIRQFTNQRNINTSYFSWQEDISEINWSEDQDVELPNVGKSADIDAVCSLAKSYPEATLVILSDGYFELKSEQRHLLTQLDNLYIVSVGGDANLVQLNTLSEHSYHAEKIDQALHTLSRSKVATVPPLSRVSMKATLFDDEEDEW
ncbi:hypothetical protein [Photobacterium damselae]|uniref:hypothetical protein n=1 Tax=Photobacterium damselae TaxID=38293 RepID=UPI0010765270|nr:hypothetical protein [Photobacterium damselae]MBE8127762.1 hypothetical protein [Photobacterium damselae subsp. piscicida]TLS88311.1 hypothetical protein FD720_05625 [Photobacterium damselae subsp. damselae]WIH22021.1 hypothetical protein KQY33_20320 [Photobacterium damselae]